MKYGLIGEKLAHSFSKEIHSLLFSYDYELVEIEKQNLDKFFKSKDFLGINVTIPYKTEVLKYLDFVDNEAQKIGAVNTVVNKGSKLYGYNTDAFGLTSLINMANISVNGKKVLILGSGGTSKTALFVAENLGAQSVYRVSRTEKDGFITYEQALKTDAQIIINTTPVGMYPNTDNIPIDLSHFYRLEAVVDVIYNPIKTRLILSAEKRGITAVGGLYMLVAQAYKSAELFMGRKPEISIETVYKKILSDKQNIVLIGMPSAGKTTIGQMLSQMLDMPFFDCDEKIKERTGKTPAEIINNETEAVFRQIETSVIKGLSEKTNCIIATGGGAVTVDENITLLKQNGRIYYIDRPIDLLTPTSDRPLSSSKDKLLIIFEKRKTLYENACDVKIQNNTDSLTAAEKIRKDFYE